VTESEDLTVNIASGGTLELWIHCTHYAAASNVSICYDPPTPASNS
jgi:hypothetical protein